jgi:hypothetical protein
MFGALAPKLRDMGWQSLIPLIPHEKRPAISKWEQFNLRPPTDNEIEGWVAAAPGSGIGLAYGPDRVIAADQDFSDPQTAATVANIVGETPLVRMGRPPKRLTLYKASRNLFVPGKAFGGFELYSTSGQTVLYKVHPDTGRPYD